MTTKFIEYSKYIQEGLIMAECATDLLVKKVDAEEFKKWLEKETDS